MTKLFGKPLSIIFLYGTLLHGFIWIGGRYLIQLLAQHFLGWTISLTLAPAWHVLIMVTLIIATSFTDHIEKKKQVVVTPSDQQPRPPDDQGDPQRSDPALGNRSMVAEGDPGQHP